MPALLPRGCAQKALTALCAAALALFCLPVSASAAPLMEINSSANTTAAPGGALTYHLAIANIGDEASPDTDGDGIADEPRVLTATLPPGITATAAFSDVPGIWTCAGNGPGPDPEGIVGATAISCTDPAVSDPKSGDRVTLILLEAAVDPDASGVLTASFHITGGGASPADSVDPTLISPSPPGFGFDAFDGQVTDRSGDPYTQAGGHPYQASTSFFFNTFHNPSPLRGDLWPAELPKDISVELPPGFVGDPSATGGLRCTLAQLANALNAVTQPLCPSGSQVGVVKTFTNNGAFLNADPEPVFSMQAPPGVPARFGFNAAGTIVTMDAEVRSDDDYGISVNVRNIPQALPIIGTEITFWGAPADPSHDLDRACPGENTPAFTGPSCDTDLPTRAFLRNPTACTPAGTGLETTIRADSWPSPGVFKSAGFTSHNPPAFPAQPSEWGPPQGPTGCALTPFNPRMSAQPTTHAADSPTGLAVDLSIPQEALADPDLIAQSDLKKAVVTLPEGMTASPAAANGLAACSSGEIDLHGRNTEPTCPESSRIGVVTVDTPLLEDPLEGSVYLAAQDDNPFNSLIAIYIVARGPGTVIKLPGKIDVDPLSGRLEATFDNQPQLPFSHLRLNLFGGPSAPLRTPSSCGTFTTEAQLTPWARPETPVSRPSTFQITQGPNGQPCPGGEFNPTLSAGTTNPLAGHYSPFVLRVTREDGTRRLTGLDVALPEGLSGKLAGIPYCPDSALAAVPVEPGTGAAQLSSPSCPAASLVGSVSVGAGAGPNPFYISTGKAYLAGPYKGAPLSLAVLTPAVAGPFDLGNVLVRTALYVDPTTAKLRAVSDPLPTILQGIPLDLRDVLVTADRPRFTLNPTSCEPMSIRGQVSGTGQAIAAVSDDFQVTNCAALRFRPALALSLRGGTRRAAHPALRAVLKMPAGGANISRATVTLPRSAILDQGHIRTVCTRVQFAAEACPPGSIYGHARAITPLLDRPLEGPVYLRSSSHKLPDLVAALDGQIHIDLDGRIDSVHGAIRNTFALVPDAPVRKFVLTMQGGKKGLIVNSRDLCAGTNRATVNFSGQNGKARGFRPLVKPDCGKGAKRQHHERGNR